ncbi:MAG: periplasmic heavy metal sensor [Prosthecobacter sp.]
MNARVRWMLISMACAALLAGVTAWLVTDWTLHRHSEHHTHGGQEQPDLHAWMHAHLDLTPEQHDTLEPIEAGFETQRTKLKAEVRAAGLALADTIRDSKENDPALDTALQRLNKAQGDLQRATLEHFFAMKRYLRPAQARKLLEWTHDSLTRD